MYWFWSYHEKVQGCVPNDDDSYTEAYQTHSDCGYGYKLVCCYDDKYSRPVQIYQGENVVYEFMDKMSHEVKYYKNIARKKFNKPLEMTNDDELSTFQTNE